MAFWAGEIDDALEQAFDECLTRFRQRDTVTGVDIGYKWTARKTTLQPCVRIFVREKFPKRLLGARHTLPKDVSGIATDVVQGVYVNHGAPPQHGWFAPQPERQVRVDPVQPGTSIGVNGGPPGTLGLLVRDNASGQPCLLSCRHVLAAPPAAPGDRVFQPAQEDGGIAADAVATLLRTNRQTEAALARLDAPGRAQLRAQFGSGVEVSAHRFPRLGDVLEKSGRTTGVTRARIDGIGHYGALHFAFRLVPVANSGNIEVSFFGDSGAIWYDPATAAGVGLHVQGELDPRPAQEHAIATSLTKVLGLLNASLLPAGP